jgi:DNA polymerase-1
MTPTMEKYAAMDAVRTLQVRHSQENYMADIDRQDLPHYFQLDAPMIWVVLDMPPVAIDVDGWLKLADDNLEYGLGIQDELGFNVKSPEQSKEAIHENVGREVKSTDKKKVLEPLLAELEDAGRDTEAEWLKKLMEARMYRDASSRYGANWTEKFLEVVDGANVMYGDWKVTGTETGRMSCSNPPLQTIPVRNMPQFRDLFISRHPGGQMIVGDYSQQELRVLAHFSKDENLLEALNSGRDLHQETTDDFRLDDRRKGKDINLGLNYGMSPEGLAYRVGITVNAAREGIRKRNARYPDSALWMEKMIRRGYRLGYVESSFGRQQWLNPHSPQMERNAINGPVQMSAADQTKAWMIQIREACRAESIPYFISLSIHDEVVADTPKGQVRKYKKIMRDAARRATELTLPGIKMPVDFHVGKSWAAKSDE